MNGQLLEHATLAAGTNILRVESSGIYFVRFTAANEQVVVKKLVVR